MLKVFDKLAGQ